MAVAALGSTMTGRDEGWLDGVLLRLLDDPTFGAALGVVGLLVAVGVGAVHALGPGHGKALVGAYLLGTRGRPRDAVALGVLVAAMHTVSVLVVAVALRAGQRWVDDPRLEAVLTLLAATGVTAVGVALLVRRLRRRRPRGAPAVVTAATGGSEHHHHAPRHEHASRPRREPAARHYHDPAARHHHDPAARHHHELPDGVAPLSWAGVCALAGAGGLVPSPVALLVLLTAIATGRTAYGIGLLAAFSVGLALTLSTVGLAVLYGRDRLVPGVARLGPAPRIGAALPLAGSLAVVLGGLVLAGGATRQLLG
jgi:ABC-type nickel/cobalt efflux system permease component RcnA